MKLKLSNLERKQSSAIKIEEKYSIEEHPCDASQYITRLNDNHKIELEYKEEITKLEQENSCLRRSLDKKEDELKIKKYKNIKEKMMNFSKLLNKALSKIESLYKNTSDLSISAGNNEKNNESFGSNSSNSSLVTVMDFKENSSIIDSAVKPKTVIKSLETSINKKKSKKSVKTGKDTFRNLKITHKKK